VHPAPTPSDAARVDVADVADDADDAGKVMP
jgi:hypothetical protein